MTTTSDEVCEENKEIKIKYVIGIILLLATCCALCVVVIIIMLPHEQDFDGNANIEPRPTTTRSTKDTFEEEALLVPECRQKETFVAQNVIDFVWRHATKLAVIVMLVVMLFVVLFVCPRPLMMVAKFLFLVVMSLVELLRMAWSVVRLPVDALKASY